MGKPPSRAKRQSGKGAGPPAPMKGNPHMVQGQVVTKAGLPMRHRGRSRR